MWARKEYMEPVIGVDAARLFGSSGSTRLGKVRVRPGGAKNRYSGTAGYRIA